jgi:hypothetical protein
MLDQIGPWLNNYRAAFGMLGAVLMLLFAWRIVRAPRCAAGKPGGAIRSLFVTYVTAAAFNAMNPMLMLLMLGGAATLLNPVLPGDIHSVLAGLFLGSITWWICLSSLTTLLRTRISPLAMGIIDKVIVVMLLSFSAEAAARAMGVLA